MLHFSPKYLRALGNLQLGYKRNINKLLKSLNNIDTSRHLSNYSRTNTPNDLHPVALLFLPELTVLAHNAQSVHLRVKEKNPTKYRSNLQRKVFDFILSEYSYKYLTYKNTVLFL